MEKVAKYPQRTVQVKHFLSKKYFDIYAREALMPLVLFALLANIVELFFKNPVKGMSSKPFIIAFTERLVIKKFSDGSS